MAVPSPLVAAAAPPSASEIAGRYSAISWARRTIVDSGMPVIFATFAGG